MRLRRVLARLDARFLGVLVLFTAGAWLLYREEIIGAIVRPVRLLTAQVTLTVLRWCGMEAVREGSAIYHPAGFAYEISRGCTGLLPIAFLVVAVCAYPSAWRDRLVGLAIGLPLLVVLNVGRLTHLFYVGVHQPELFALAHRVIWQSVIVLGVFGAWFTWARWTDRRRASAPKPAPAIGAGRSMDATRSGEFPASRSAAV